jgi:Ceramidase
MASSLRFKSLASYDEIYRKAFRRSSGFVFAQPPVAPCRYRPAPALPVVQDNRRSRIIRLTAYNSMTIIGTVRDRPVLALYGLMIVTLAALLPLPPLLQDQSYHQFADQRELFGIPNFWNVVSNLPFIAVGAVGLLQVRRDAITIVLFTGLFLTGFGSSYYHLNPNDGTLFWDRLPMTLCFAAILAAVVEERVDARAGAMLLRPLLAIGVFSLLLWRWTDDLRLYAWAQFFPFLALVLILRLFPPKYTGASYWITAAALYALAKLLEFFDEKIFSVGSIVSGHTLKHLAAAAAGFAILRLFLTRLPIDGVV